MLPPSSSSSSRSGDSGHNKGVVTHEQFLDDLRQQMGSDAYLIDTESDTDEDDANVNEHDDGTLHTVPMPLESIPSVMDRSLDELFLRQKSMGTRLTEESSCWSY